MGIEALKKKDQLTAEQQRQQENIMLKERELEDIRKQWELETDPEKKAELAKQMAAKGREIESLKKQAQITAEQEKRIGEILDKELELAELQRKFDLETDPVKKAELARQMANKQKEIEMLKRHEQLADEKEESRSHCRQRK